MGFHEEKAPCLEQFDHLLGDQPGHGEVFEACPGEDHIERFRRKVFRQFMRVADNVDIVSWVVVETCVAGLCEQFLRD